MFRLTGDARDENYGVYNPIRATEDFVHVNKIDNASTQGVQHIKDIRFLVNEYGLPKSFDESTKYYDFEQYVVFNDIVSQTLISSTLAVIIVVLIITSDVSATVLVTCCICLTDLFLVGLIFYWNLTFNALVMLQIVLAIGTSVDYSVHIAYAYLVEPIPERKKAKFDTKEKIRMYKAQMALTKMGSSVFHGGFSTFLAISVLGPAKTYIFLVFYRLWFGIILFGMTNGFLFLPVLLSIFGPTVTVEDLSHDDDAES